MRAFVNHPWGAVFDSESKVLILGTMPSPKTRENGFYYGHPQNIFWKTLASVLGKAEPEHTMAACDQFLLENHIALWDVIKSCDIKGANDADIRNVIVNDFREIFETAKIKKVFTTGKTATMLFNKHCAKDAGMEAEYLPSTSPANRIVQSKPEYMEAWLRIKEFL